MRPTRRARAQALVEAAVSFPLLVLLLLAIVEGALYVHAPRSSVAGPLAVAA